MYIYSNRGDSSTRQMGERSNRAGEGVPPIMTMKSQGVVRILIVALSDPSLDGFRLACLALILEG